MQVCLCTEEDFSLKLMFLRQRLDTVKNIVWPQSTVHTRRKFFGLGEQFPHNELNLKVERYLSCPKKVVLVVVTQKSHHSSISSSMVLVVMKTVPISQCPFYDRLFNGVLFTIPSCLNFLSGRRRALPLIQLNGRRVCCRRVSIRVLTAFTDYRAHGSPPVDRQWCHRGLARPLEDGRGYVDNLLNNGVRSLAFGIKPGQV